MPDTVATPVTTGRYRHYKGQEYEVLAEAAHTETGEVFVVYRALYGDRDVWVRPKQMFCEAIQVAGRRRRRFVPVK
jgi:hypothetical protein